MSPKILLWLLYYPLVKILYFLVFWVPEVVERKRFELRNRKEALCRSFKEEGKTADYCFEFSSEGEYQQVASLIEDTLKEGKLLELVFFSPSVEKAIIELALKYPTQIRYLRYPIATFGLRHSFSKWVSSTQLIMVRYDLFPEFLIWAINPYHRLKILWVTFKKERVRGKSISWLKRRFLERATHLVYASLPDQKVGEELGHKGSLYDFRIEQIRRRIELRDEKFARVFPPYFEMKKLWEKYPRQKRLIIGNAWPSDLQIIHDLPEDFFVLIVPHKLEPEIFKSFRDGLMDLERMPEEVSDERSRISSHTLILNKKGVLCELYSDFGKAYVGGGFETSIHSVLEPLTAGVDQLSCGPLHHRSTEYDLAQSYGDMCELRSPQDFSAWISSTQILNENKLSLEEILSQYEARKEEVLSC